MNNLNLMLHDAKALRHLAEVHHQGHLFAHYYSLCPVDREKLLDQIAHIEFDVIDRLVADLLNARGCGAQVGKLELAPVITLPVTLKQKKAEQAARLAGEEAFRQGRVGCFLVAGGQSTRLGLNGPKGAFVIGPISERTLFQIHAEKILALRRRYNACVPWLIMTSDTNDDETRSFFARHNYYNLGANTVRIFKQANMPAVSRDGKILLAAKGNLALSPNGHGGSIKAIWDSGACAWLKTMSVDTLSYFQVDNPLVKIGDPLFIGHHVLAHSQLSTKVCRKRVWNEKVGVLALRHGRLSVVEYSDLSDDLAKETDARGDLKWWAGNVAIHVLDVDFIEQLNHGGFQLPYHQAEKAIPCLDSTGQPVSLKPNEKNGIKFETFIFDALGQAQRTINFETRRDEEFSPIKNAQGEDSPQSARRDMQELYARWLTAAGVYMPRKADGALDCRIEISPLTSLDGERLADVTPKVIQPGESVQW
ncbi:MAG: UTP--glucose-1-phosphate uridylyltransferase [Planctomycetota bacterium]